MKKIFSVILLIGMLLGSLVIFSPGNAEAVAVEINNHFGQPLITAFVYFDENSNEWMCTGWYTVDPNSVRTVNFPQYNRPDIYVHMHNSSYTWGSQRYWTVRDQAFKYIVQYGCPSGSGLRKEPFDRHPVDESGTVHIDAR